MNRSSRTELGADFREGGRLLWLAILKLGWKQADLARELSGELGRRVTPGTVHPWLYGDSRPEDETARAIEALLARHGQRVPAGAWSDLAKRGFDLAAERGKRRKIRPRAAA